MKTTHPTKPISFNEWVAYIRQMAKQTPAPDYSEIKKALQTEKIVLS